MEIRVHFFLFLMMLLQLLNWRSFLALIAIAIVSATIFFSDFLSKKIAREEKQKIEQWVEAVKEVSSEGSNQTNLTGKILTENSRDIPMIAVTEKDSILDHYNIDTLKIAANNNYLQQKLAEFKGQNEPIVWQNPLDPTQNNKVYYGKSALLKQIQYFPLIQLMVGALFILITLLAVAVAGFVSPLALTLGGRFSGDLLAPGKTIVTGQNTRLSATAVAVTKPGFGDIVG